jgi:hypothetical protein
LTDTSIESLAISGTNLFAGTNFSGVWMRPLSQMITGVKDEKKFLPICFSLQQNYPNPFNPTTTIQYAIPKPEHVSLKVYNILGKEVAELVNENKQAGNYSVLFSANSGYSSGVYFYRITAGEYSETKKLVLLK